MIALTLWPRVLPEATAARSMSPVARCTRPCVCSSRFACVPLPAPGGPSRIKFIGSGSSRKSSPAAPQLCPFDQPLVLVGEQVRVNLRHGIHRDADDDQEAGPAEIER